MHCALLVSAGIDAAAPSRAHGVEVQMAVFDDRSFGALVSFGLAGLATDLLGDRAYAAVPLTDRRRGRADRGAAGRAAAARLRRRPAGGHLGLLADLALRLSALGDALPEIAECASP